MKIRCHKSALLCGTAAIFLGGAAHAQDQQAPVDETRSVEANSNVIVVTAQKREQDVQDVGISIAAFGAGQLEALGIASADDIADSVSGIQVYNYRGKGQPSFIIRGVGTQDFAPNTSPTAAVYVDEVYLGSNIVTGFNIYDVERAEVLKGPQGTLFGRNTTGGAVSYTSKRPSDVFEGYVEIGYANFETVDAKIGVGGPITDGLRMRVAGIYSDQGKGIYTNRFTPDQNPFGPTPNFQRFKSNIGEDETWAARLTAEVDIGADGLLSLNVHGGEKESDTLPVTPIGFTTIAGSGGTCQATPTGGQVSDPAFCGDAFGYSDTDGDPYTVSNDYVGYNEESNFGVSGKLGWDFDGFSLTSITAYESADKFFTADSDGSPFGVFNIFYDIGFDQFSQEVRINSADGGNLYWIVGGYYGHDKITQAFCGDLNPLLGLGIACRNDFKQVTDTLAAYGQAEYFLTPELRATAGLRYTKETRDFNSVSTLTDVNGVTTIANFGDGPEDAAIIDDTLKSSNFSGKVALDYFVNDDVLVYVSASRGFKSGGYDGDFSFDRQQLDPYDEEILTAYELGWKTTFADGRVRINGAAFYYDYKNPQIRVQRVSAGGFPFNQLITLDKSKIYGLELEVTVEPADGLTLQSSVSLLDTEIVEDSADPSLALFDGNQFALAAQTSFTVLARYETEISSNLRASIQLDGKYNGDYQLNAENLPWLEQDDYFLANARLTIGQIEDGVEFSLWGKNLLDQTFSVGSYSLFGAYPIYYNEPRTYGASVSYKW